MLDRDNLMSMWNTIKIAFWVTLLGTIVGVFYAWLLGRSDIPAKGLMFLFCTLTDPDLTATIALIFIISLLS